MLNAQRIFRFKADGAISFIVKIPVAVMAKRVA
jgi:hypothetical protein